MVFKGVQLGSKITVLDGRRAIDGTLVVDIDTSSTELGRTGSETGISVLDLVGQVSVLDVLTVNILTHGTVVSGAVIIVALEVNIFTVELGVQVSDAHELTLGVLQSDLLVAEVSTAAIDKASCVFALT